MSHIETGVWLGDNTAHYTTLVGDLNGGFRHAFSGMRGSSWLSAIAKVGMARYCYMVLFQLGFLSSKVSHVSETSFAASDAVTIRNFLKKSL